LPESCTGCEKKGFDKLRILICIVLLAVLPFSIYSSQRLPEAYSGIGSESVAELSSEVSPELGLLSMAANAHIMPAHQALETNTSSLLDASKALCDKTSGVTISELRRSWATAMASWSVLAPIGFGPIDEANSGWHFQFWPDPINLVHRKFKSRIKGVNKDIGAEVLVGASVAIQGLSAMEYLLFDQQVDMASNYLTKPHFCKILQATALNLTNYSQTLNAAWQGEYPTRWLDQAREKAAPGYFLRNVEGLFSNTVIALDIIKHKKLGAPLGYKKKKNKKKTKINPWLLESWRSQTSLQNIRATLVFSSTLYTMDSGLAWFLKHRSIDCKELDQEIRQSFAEAINQIDAIEVSALELLQSNKTEQLESLYQSVKRLHKLLKTDYAKKADILFRFNARDGD